MDREVLQAEPVRLVGDPEHQPVPPLAVHACGYGGSQRGGTLSAVTSVDVHVFVPHPRTKRLLRLYGATVPVKQAFPKHSLLARQRGGKPN